MDAFVEHLFPNYGKPDINFGPFDAGMVNYACAKGSLKVEEAAGFRRQKNISLTQPMTLLGLSSAYLSQGPSCLSGLCKDLFSPNGLLDLNALNQKLYDYGYTESRRYIDSYPNWKDNHVSLIVNCIRYALIRHAFEQNPNPVSQSWPDFNDGVVNVDRNQWWPAEYPSAESTWTRSEWPGGNDANNYPSFKKAPEKLPSSPDSSCFLDLRGLSIKKARFIILMLGEWNRRSRMMLDFSLPILAESVVYRADENVECVVDWNSMPPAPTADEAWSAMMDYVAVNGLFDHFSVALHVVISVMYQMLPVTAEGQYWLSLERRIKLPTFSSIRGRYTLLSSHGFFDYGVSVTKRSIGEWTYIIRNDGLRNLHLIGVLFAQAMQTGFAIPALSIVKRYPYKGWCELQNAASEAVGFEVPDSGMSGVNVMILDDICKYDEERVMNITTNGVAGLKKVPWFVLPGIPTLIMPIKPFPTNSPLALKGEIKAEEEATLVGGHRVKADMAWEIANLCHMCGYSLAYDTDGVFRVPADVAMMWPLYFDPETKDRTVNLTKMTEKEVVKIELPPMCNLYFRNLQLKYEVKIYRRGVISHLENLKYEL